MIVNLLNLRDIETFDFTYSFNEEQLKQANLLKLDNVSIKGFVKKNSLNLIDINMEINGVMILPCALTLKPVEYPFNIKIEDGLDKILEEIGEKAVNSLDIFPIVWENILLEIPSKVVADEVNTSISGDGWKLITEEKGNTPFEELLK